LYKIGSSNLPKSIKKIKFLGARHQGKLRSWRKILLTWLEHLEESFCFKEVQFKKVSLPVKTSCPTAENVK